MSEEADAVAVRLAAKWRSEQLVLTEIITEAVRSKTPPPNNYWHAEHEARRKLQIATIIAQELEGT